MGWSDHSLGRPESAGPRRAGTGRQQPQERCGERRPTPDGGDRRGLFRAALEPRRSTHPAVARDAPAPSPRDAGATLRLEEGPVCALWTWGLLYSPHPTRSCCPVTLTNGRSEPPPRPLGRAAVAHLEPAATSACAACRPARRCLGPGATRSSLTSGPAGPSIPKGPAAPLGGPAGGIFRGPTSHRQRPTCPETHQGDRS